MKTTRLDRSVVTEVNEKLTDAMEIVLDKYGLGIDRWLHAKVGYNELSVQLKFDVYIKTEGGLNLAKVIDFNEWREDFGLKCDIGFTFKDRRSGQKNQVIGLSPKKKKFPVDLLELGSGKRFESSVAHVNSYITTTK